MESYAYFMQRHGEGLSLLRSGRVSFVSTVLCALPILAGSSGTSPAGTNKTYPADRSNRGSLREFSLTALPLR
jgi:hypothetical protein